MNIAFVGPMRSGKTTAATYLVEKHGYTRLALADPIKDISEYMLNTLIMQFLPYLKDRQDALGVAGAPPILLDRQEMDDAKPTFRPHWQWLGTEFGRDYLKAPNLWIDVFLDRVKHTLGPIVCDDVRFPNEAGALREAGFRILRIDRPEEDRNADQRLEQLSHPSETALVAIVPDATIPNASTVSALYEGIDLALRTSG